MRTITCAECGKTVEIEGYARRVKYCPECREKVHKEKARIRYSARHKAQKAKAGKDDLHTLDTPQNIKMCLSCSLPKCKMKSVGCPLYRQKGA